jgi:type III secretion protein SpaR/YscT/HrcT
MDSPTATDTYVSMLLSLPNIQPATLLSYFFLTMARLLPIIVIAPFFGSKNVPRVIRMMFGMALTAIFLPQNVMHITGTLPFSVTFVGLLLKELLIGITLAFLASIPFYIASMAGTMIDHQRGASSLQITDPNMQTQTSSIGVLYNYVLIAIFFSLNGPFIFFDGIATSYQLIPVDGFINTALFTMNTPLKKLGIHLLATMMNLTIQLSAPALIGILVTDMFLGIANRLAPQVQIVFLGLSLKSWIGIGLMAAAWGLVVQVMGKEAVNWFKSLNQLIEQVGRYYMQKS